MLYHAESARAYMGVNMYISYFVFRCVYERVYVYVDTCVCEYKIVSVCGGRVTRLGDKEPTVLDLKADE